MTKKTQQTKPETKTDETQLDRRAFIAGVSATGVALGSAATKAGAQTAEGQMAATAPSEAQRVADLGALDEYSADEHNQYFVDNPGSDYMIDVLRSLNIDYVATNPGSSFRGLQESLVNYGGNTKPELLTCTHEEQAVAMGHGYYKVAGKPLAVAAHGTVGIQHAAMAVYNAWCDRAPVVLIAGNHLDATHRRLGVEWAHSATDCLRPIRDYIKWDDMPVSLPHFAESTVRAYKLSMTPPEGPVAIVCDGHLQEEEAAGHGPMAVPRLSPTQPPRGDANAVEEAARWLAEAESPVIVVDRYAHDQEGVELLVELAETLQAPVVDRRGRMNFPNTHYLYQGRGELTRADVILGLELNDVFGIVNSVRDIAHKDTRRLVRPDARVITIGVNDLFMKSNYQNFQRYFDADLSIAGDAQATLASLTESVRSAMPRSTRSALADREERLRAQHARRREEVANAARYGWNSSPVSTARIAMETYNAVKDKDWALVSQQFFTWQFDLWDMEQHYHHIGGSGGAGVGYGAPSSVGAALAHREHGRIAVNFQNDGDLMYVPGVLWTAAHHEIPLLSVMHNNRAYHQEVMHLQRMSARRRRGLDGAAARIGNTIDDPAIDYAALGKSLGIWTAGPIEDPADLAPALAEGVAMVEQGVPVLIDVVAQPR